MPFSEYFLQLTYTCKLYLVYFNVMIRTVQRRAEECMTGAFSMIESGQIELQAYLECKKGRRNKKVKHSITIVY